MGLDMYVYRVEKPELDTSKVFDVDKISGIVLSEEDINDPMYREILPYCDKVQAVRHYYDIEKLKAESGAESIHLSSIIGGVLSFTGTKPDGQSVTISKSDAEIDESYTVDREETCYVCSYTEIRYWRKAYDIQDWFYDHIGHVENTGYYILSKELLQDFNEKFEDEELPVEAPNEKYAYCYWEWY